MQRVFPSFSSDWLTHFSLSINSSCRWSSLSIMDYLPTTDTLNEIINDFELVKTCLEMWRYHLDGVYKSSLSRDKTALVLLHDSFK